MSLTRELAAGALAGFGATAPMTAVMGTLHYTLREEREPLPPEQITENLAEKAGVAEGLPHGWREPASLVAHFGYGAAAGALYGPIAARSPLSPVVGGIAYGLGFWAVSYLGYLPAFGLRRSIAEDPPQRTTMMVAAHVAWGAALGASLGRRGGRGER